MIISKSARKQRSLEVSRGKGEYLNIFISPLSLLTKPGGGSAFHFAPP